MLISSLVLIILAESTAVSEGASLSISTPEYLWAVVNSSLSEKKVPRHCAKIVFHNNDTMGESNIPESQQGIVNTSFIDIQESVIGGNFHQWSLAEKNLKEATRRSIEEKLDPCVTVVSFVLNSSQYNLTILGRRKSINYHMVDLLQHSTPIIRRHLVLIRLSHSLDDFRFCTKAAKYPIRLVPDWEMFLFDFFTDVRVVQGFFYENGEETHPYVRISKEMGRWKWLCEDIIQNLEIARSCNHNFDQKCLEEHPEFEIWKPGDVEKPCKHGFRPRQ